MQNLTITQISMSSLDITELVGSRHDKVKQSIERLAEKGVIQLPPMGKVENKQSNSPNRFTEAYHFEGEQGKRDSIIVVAQLSPEFTARLVDRWQELENAHLKYPVPQTFSEALMLAAELAKKNELLTDERDEAVRTKAQISEKREATACQRNAVYQRIANKAIKEREEMAALLGASKDYASVRSVWRATGNWYSYRQLTTWQDEHDAMESYYWDESTDARILCYPREAWLEVYDVDIAKLF
ncbi:Rha family transcriptional regulator [Candidatus Symbiopectobacterium sp.]|uniref:Rha family transcriptional regulator n=1 Tax=Candidatus Symbiopectobacterium sp. TaxID=2816440 RepID=UPI0025BE1F06|nr:Rha family transcriptional regulator [Candidatus Symbiopectobacterium sp.]